MKAIVAVNENWGIGCNNKLLYSIPGDMKYFRATTMNKVVVMGRSTFESLPGSQPLKNRINIILSRDETLKIDSAIVCNSTEQLLDTIKAYDSNDVFLIGGQEIYSRLLEFCSEAYITKIKDNKGADKFFPNVDLMDNWVIEETSEEKIDNDICYRFCKYKNNNFSG